MAVAVGVSGVGAGDAVAEVALNPCQGGVAQPVDRDALGGDPGESLADTEPEVVVAAAGQGVAVAVAQQLIGGQERTPTGGVVGQADREGGADGLPADGAALLAELDQAVVGVEVGAAQGQAAPRRHAVFGAQPEQQRVEGDVVAAGASGEVDLLEFLGGRGSRVLGRRRGLATRRAGLALAAMCPSAMDRV
jgi:hypothetical protein